MMVVIKNRQRNESIEAITEQQANDIMNSYKDSDHLEIIPIQAVEYHYEVSFKLIGGRSYNVSSGENFDNRRYVINNIEVWPGDTKGVTKEQLKELVPGFNNTPPISNYLDDKSVEDYVRDLIDLESVDSYNEHIEGSFVAVKIDDKHIYID